MHLRMSLLRLVFLVCLFVSRINKCVLDTTIQGLPRMPTSQITTCLFVCLQLLTPQNTSEWYNPTGTMNYDRHNMGDDTLVDNLGDDTLIIY